MKVVAGRPPNFEKIAAVLPAAHGDKGLCCNFADGAKNGCRS